MIILLRISLPNIRIFGCPQRHHSKWSRRHHEVSCDQPSVYSVSLHAPTSMCVYSIKRWEWCWGGKKNCLWLMADPILSIFLQSVPDLCKFCLHTAIYSMRNIMVPTAKEILFSRTFPWQNYHFPGQSIQHLKVINQGMCEKAYI